MVIATLAPTREVVSEVPAADPGRAFFGEVMAATAGRSRLQMCIQCGTCGGSCPSGEAMDHTPRALFALIRAGRRDEVLHSNTPWLCVSCYECVVRCPQEVHITDVMYALKSMAEAAGVAPSATATGFSNVFAGNVRRFGRSYEIGLTARHYLRHFVMRLPRMAPMGLGLMRHGRIRVLPARITERQQLQAVLRAASQPENPEGPVQ